jgi:hypothetical protein
MGNYSHMERTFSSVDLRDFESILLYFSDEEIEELQAAIDERCNARAHLGDGDTSGMGYSPKCLEEGSRSPLGERIGSVTVPTLRRLTR